jgi:HPt (histidine-containing phosphotransfer) domain-containing protein
MDDHVAKPIEPQELFQALLKWVKPREGADALAAAPGTLTGAAAARAAHEPKLPTGIAGLDTGLGLRRVLGKVPRYLSMLEKYVAGQSGTVTALREALAAGDRETATRLAHTTKGVSGNIGATVVQQRADELETALQQGTPLEQTTHLVDTLAQHLQPLVAAIAAQLEQPPKQADGPAVDRAAAPAAIDEAQLAAVTQRLRKLLEDMDSDASDWINAHAKLLGAAYPGHLPALLEALEGFDFDVAIQHLDAGIAEAGRTPPPRT